VLFVGRLVPEKGTDRLLEIVSRFVGLTLTVAGDGPERPRLEGLARDLGIAGRVEFLGAVARDRIGALYRACRAVAVPSLWPEPFGIIGLEAMAAGRPVVAFRTGGIPEWLEDGVNGLSRARRRRGFRRRAPAPRARARPGGGARPPRPGDRRVALRPPRAHGAPREDPREGRLVRVAFYAHPLLYPRAGIGNYSFWLVRELLAAAPDLEIVLFGVNAFRPAAWRAVEERLRPLGPAVKVARTRFPTILDTLCGGRILPRVEARALRRAAPDVVFTPKFVLPFRPGAPAVLMVHDLVFRVMPETVTDVVKSELETHLPRCLGFAAAVMVPSESTRRDLLREFAVDPAKVVVVPEAVGPGFRPVEDPARREAARRRWSLPPRYLLAVGTVEPRKNVPLMLRLAERLRGRGERLPIVVAGARGWKCEGIYEEHRARGLQQEVLFLGRVGDEDLPALYSMAEALLFPSFYEGFGFPPLEAMACGCPVVAARTSSIPEVAGDAAVLVDDPRDVEAFERAVLGLLADAPRRAELRERGLRQAAGFTWRRAALETAAVLRTAARGAG
jgi:glycosyltransferase involved in cell wall biosynthesis